MIDITVSNSFYINILIHCTILFIFLYFFFFFVISKKAEDILNQNIDNICDNNLPDILSYIDNNYGDKIDWENLKKKCEDIYDNPNESINNNINNNNNKYRKIGIYIFISLIIILVLFYFYVVFYKKENINIKSILVENFFTFLLIGAIEYIFFIMVASKYIPAYPTVIGGVVLERIKKNIKEIN
jgi:hypothetical protein